MRSAFSYVRHFKMGTSSASLSKSNFAEKIVTICGLIPCYNSRVKKCKQGVKRGIPLLECPFLVSDASKWEPVPLHLAKAILWKKVLPFVEWNRAIIVELKSVNNAKLSLDSKRV